MKKLNEVFDVNKPNQIQILSNNSYYYNHNIKPTKGSVFEKVENKEIIKEGWSFTPIYIIGKPSYKDCVRHIIREYLSQDEEFDLINSYNRNLINGNKLRESSEYSNYLNLLDIIKQEVKICFNKNENNGQTGK